MIDLRNWFLMPSVQAGLKVNGSVYGRETHHLEGMNLTNNTKVYAYHSDTGKAMIFSKAPQKDSSGKLTQCWPWDVKEYDEQFIYDTATELNWSSPKDFKKMNPRIPMCPRYWNGDPTLFTFSQHAAYLEYQNCKVTGQGDVGPAYYTLQHVGDMDYKGDVGISDTILLTYYWTDKKNREQLFLTDKAGWVDWTHSTRQQLSQNIADYIVDVRVTHNKIVAGTLAPQLPCLSI